MLGFIKMNPTNCSNFVLFILKQIFLECYFFSIYLATFLKKVPFLRMLYLRMKKGSALGNTLVKVD